MRRASLGDLEAAALWNLVRQPVSANMVSYVASYAATMLYCDPELRFPREGVPERGIASSHAPLPTLYAFVGGLVRAANVPSATLVSTLVYLVRLKARLARQAFTGVRCTAHRIFLSVLILTSKYLNDRSPSNRRWAEYCHMSTGAGALPLGCSDLQRLEVQTLDLLGWDLSLDAADLYRASEPFLVSSQIGLSCDVFAGWRYTPERGVPATAAQEAGWRREDKAWQSRRSERTSRGFFLLCDTDVEHKTIEL